MPVEQTKPWANWLRDPSQDGHNQFGEMFADFVADVIDANIRYDRENRRVGLIGLLSALEHFFDRLTAIQPLDTQSIPMRELAFPVRMLVEVLHVLTPAESERLLHHQVIRRIEHAVAAGAVECLVKTGWKLNRAIEFVGGRIKVPAETLTGWRDAILRATRDDPAQEEPPAHIRAFHKLATAQTNDVAATMALVEHQLHLFFPPNRKRDVERRGAKPKRAKATTA